MNRWRRSSRALRRFLTPRRRCLTEEDSSFRPVEGTWTVAQQVAHVAKTVEWFVEGMFRPEGFDLDFEEHVAEILRYESLAEARAWNDRAFAQAIEVVKSRSAEELAQPLPAGPVMGGAPRAAVISAIGDHTAHHRGVLTVYARLLGKVPMMPYAEEMAEVEAAV